MDEGSNKQTYSANDVEEMVDAATNELNDVLSGNPELKEKLEKSIDEIRKAVKSKDFNINNEGFKNENDTKILAQLEEAERKAQQTALIINELKDNVNRLINKSEMTESESLELENKNKQLALTLQEFESRTRQVQSLVQQVDKRMYSNRSQKCIGHCERSTDSVLPKVLICGSTEENIPKIVICDAPKNVESLHESPISNVTQNENTTTTTTRINQLNEEINSCYCKEGTRPEDGPLSGISRKLNNLQAGFQGVVRDNADLSNKLTNLIFKSPNKKIACKSVCPADVETRLLNYCNTTSALEKQLVDMETEVKEMQKQLESVNRDRKMLEEQKKGFGFPDSICDAPCNPDAGIRMQRLEAGDDPVLNELHEQYKKLQEDYKDKINEISNLRADNEKLRKITQEAEYVKEDILQRLEEKEKEIRCICADRNKLADSRQYLVEQEQQLNICKLKFREAQDELEELRALIQEQGSQLEDYRNKYLQAQQEVEEQRRQIDVMEMENQRISDQVNGEIQRVKNQFQEKLTDLTALPDTLKATELKLQEVQQLLQVTEKSNEHLMKDLQAHKDKIYYLLEEIEKLKNEQETAENERASLNNQILELERKSTQYKIENDNLKLEMARMDEAVMNTDKRLEEKLHEVTQLASQLETVREDSARHVARTKERSEMIRRSLQSQIGDLERQLVQSRALARSAQKERDEIRQKMQIQINNLNENFEEAQIRIRSLQGHVNILKSSYSDMFGNDQSEFMAQDCPGCDTA